MFLNTKSKFSESYTPSIKSSKSRFDITDSLYEKTNKFKNDKNSIQIEKKIDKWLNEKGIRNIYLKEEGILNIKNIISQRKTGILENEVVLEGGVKSRNISLQLNLKRNKLFRNRLMSSKFNKKINFD